VPSGFPGAKKGAKGRAASSQSEPGRRCQMKFPFLKADFVFFLLQRNWNSVGKMGQVSPIKETGLFTQLSRGALKEGKY
jgi:hypothetical protein